MPFPKAKDLHKPGHPEVPNGFGVFYVLASSVYLFLLYFLGYEGALALASCILFGGFMGLLDDWMDLKWRYKAILPVIASIPLAALRQGHTVMATYIFGKIDFGIYYYFVIAPVIVTITTNVVNQLGGLNGLESVCPLIILTGFFLISPNRVLLIVPLLTLSVLAFLNYNGKIFVGNVGSFSFGITLAAYAIITDMEQTLLISILPYIFNSSLILINCLFLQRTPYLKLINGKITADNRRSLVTIIAYKRTLSERQIVNIIAVIFLIFTTIALLTRTLLK